MRLHFHQLSTAALSHFRAGRETFAYTGSVLRDSADGLASLMAEVITQPALHDWEVNEAKEALSAYVATQVADPRTALLEALHAAAFGATSPLGHSVLATPAALDGLDADSLRAFLSARFAADKIVIAATSAWT